MRVRWVSVVAASILLSACHSDAGGVTADNPSALTLYPATTAEPPELASPARLSDGTETVVACMKDGRYAAMPVTVENVPPTLSYGGRKIGKGNQLQVDANDFPALAKTGLHAPQELDRAKEITGKPIEAITAAGRPGTLSGEGFLAVNEGILSVLQGDNRLVQRLGLTHPDMARPLFHVWNLILKEYELGRVGRNYNNVQYVLYNGRQVRFGEVLPTRGFQESIFNDEITGAFQINLFRDPDKSEQAFLRKKYPNLSKEQMGDLVSRLSHILTGEMEPYYVMRYGFYEGHTSYRVDPVAIAFIFGLRTLEQIEAAFPATLYQTLTTHFTTPLSAQRSAGSFPAEWRLNLLSATSATNHT